MKKIIKFFSPNLKLVKGTRLISGLFIGVSIAVAAGILFAANIYYDIDTSKIMVDDTQQATTTQITVDTGNTTALTVTQRGTAAAVLVTSTDAMTSDIFQITNLGSGYSFLVENSDTDSYPFVISDSGDVGIGTTTFSGLLTVGTTTPALIVDRTGKVGVATTTPSDTFAVQGNIIGSGNIILYDTATSTFGGGLQATAIKLTQEPTAGYVLTSDANGYGYWSSDSVLTGSNWKFTASQTALTPTSTVGIHLNASSTFADDLAVSSDQYESDTLFIDASEGRLGIGTTTLAGLFTVGTSTVRLVVAPNGYVGIATSTPSDTFAVQGNIIGSGNIILYDTATSTFGGGIRTGGDIAATGGSLSIYLTSAGALSLTPQSGSDVVVGLGGTGQLKIGSNGEFYIDASGNATTSGNIYASKFFETGSSATVRKTGEEIVRGVVPIFGFDLPARCNTSCNSGSATATISRVIENNDDIFPSPYSGTTRKYRFSIRYADATTSASCVTCRTTWDVATSSDLTYESRFTLPPTTSADLAQGFTTTTNQVTLPTANDSTGNWFLRVSTGGSGGYDLQVYEILLIGLDEVD